MWPSLEFQRQATSDYYYHFGHALDKIITLAQQFRQEIQNSLKNPQRDAHSRNSDIVNYLEQVESKFATFFGTLDSQVSFNISDIFPETFVNLAFLAIFDMGLKPDRNDLDSLFNHEFFIQLFPNISQLPPESQIFKIIADLTEQICVLANDDSIPRTSTLWETFYSDFSSRFDANTKMRNGLIFTPPPIVHFIIDGINSLLKEHFGLTEGILASNALFLDPAAGLLNFFRGLVEYIIKKQTNQHSNQETTKIIQDTLRRCFAFEIMPGQTIIDQIYYQKWLSQNHNVLHQFLGTDKSLECRDALHAAPTEYLVRAEKGLPIILGNPPYNVSSKHKSPWIQELMEDYKAGLQRQGTKRISVSRLQDDYAKFFRMAQWVIDQVGWGIVAFISSRSFIDGLVHRGMRVSLAASFDDIFIVDLNGDSRDFLGGNSTGISKIIDENIFEIQQGVAVTFLVKKTKKKKNHSSDEKKSPPCDIHYISVTGTRECKFNAVSQGFTNLKFQIIKLGKDFEFSPQQNLASAEYEQYPYLLDIFQEHVQGIVSAHDSLVYDADLNRLKDKIGTFIEGGNLADWGAEARDGRDWKIAEARKETTRERAYSHIIPCAYRGFDRRWLCYDLALINKGTNRFPLMQYLTTLGNIALVTNRLSVTPMDVLVTDCVVDNGMISGARASRTYIFPLHIGDGQSNRQHSWNIRETFLHNLIYDATPEDVFYYTYGVLNTPTFAMEYAPQILKDFPRVPFPHRVELFIQMAERGRMLVEIHLLKGDKIKNAKLVMNENAKDRQVMRLTYKPVEQRVYFDKPRLGSSSDDIFWIGEITPAMWEFNIGGIPQLKHWLHARIYSSIHKLHSLPRGLTPGELLDFTQICSAIKQTLELRPKLDEIYLQIKADIIKGK